MLIGLTGGVASGKSLVAGELKRLGAKVIDADVIAREVVEPGTPAYRAIAEEFGKSVIKDDGSIDRKRLGEIVFSDPGRLKRLNEITHPPIRKRIEEEVSRLEKEDRNSLIVIDAALLIENGLHKRVSSVIVVYADERKQLERVMKRNGLTEEEALGRIRAQMPLGEKLSYADHVIYNNGTMEEAMEKTRMLYGELSRKAS